MSRLQYVIALLVSSILVASIVLAAGEWTRIGSVVYTGYRVGIGTDNPQAELHVVGNALVSGTVNASMFVEGGVPLYEKYVNYTYLHSNYYSKSDIDSWNLIKHYTLEQNLNANGYSIVNIGTLGIGTASPRARVEIVGDMMLSNPDGRYVRFFFGALNDIEFNATALIIHPVWPVYNPSGLVYFSGDPSYIRVGIGTDNPQYRLDVVGDIRARAASVYADFFKLTEGGCWGSTSSTCSGWEIDYYPEGSMVFRYTNDSGQTFTDVMKIYPFGVSMPFMFDKTMISRLEKIEMFGGTVSGWTTILDADYHGVVAIIFHNPWGAIDYIRITIDGVTKTIPIDGHTTAELPLPLVLVVDKHVKVELYSGTSVNVYYTVMWIRG